MKKLAMLSVLLVASACVAGTATLSLEVDKAAKTYQVFATVAGTDNVGLDTFNLDVVFGGGLASTMIANPGFIPELPELAPEFIPDGVLQAPGADVSSTTGFCDGIVDGDLTAPGVVNFAASQKSVYGSSYNATANGKVLQNIGKTSPVLLASGTFTGDFGTMSLNVPVTSENKPQILFLKNVASNKWFGPGNVEPVSEVTLSYKLDGEAVAGPITLVPEPTTIGLLCMGLIGLIRRK